jgi:hypothetical protein
MGAHPALFNIPSHHAIFPTKMSWKLRVFVLVFPHLRSISKRGGRTKKDKPMPSYDIRYLDSEGSLKANIATDCANDTQAKVLAHAMKTEGAKRIEVWDGPTLVYERGRQAN